MFQGETDSILSPSPLPPVLICGSPDFCPFQRWGEGDNCTAGKLCMQNCRLYYRHIRQTSARRDNDLYFRPLEFSPAPSSRISPFSSFTVPSPTLPPPHLSYSIFFSFQGTASRDFSLWSLSYCLFGYAFKYAEIFEFEGFPYSSYIVSRVI